jgi:hypothetical protein
VTITAFTAYTIADFVQGLVSDFARGYRVSRGIQASNFVCREVEKPRWDTAFEHETTLNLDYLAALCVAGR